MKKIFSLCLCMYVYATLYFIALILIVGLAGCFWEPRKKKWFAKEKESAWFTRDFSLKLMNVANGKKSQGFIPSILIKKKRRKKERIYIERPKYYIKRNHSYTGTRELCVNRSTMWWWRLIRPRFFGGRGREGGRVQVRMARILNLEKLLSKKNRNQKQKIFFEVRVFCVHIAFICFYFSGRNHLVNLYTNGNKMKRERWRANERRMIEVDGEKGKLKFTINWQKWYQKRCSLILRFSPSLSPPLAQSLW